MEADKPDARVLYRKVVRALQPDIIVVCKTIAMGELPSDIGEAVVVEIAHPSAALCYAVEWPKIEAAMQLALVKRAARGHAPVVETAECLQWQAAFAAAEATSQENSRRFKTGE